jgi:hypothetical protein
MFEREVKESWEKFLLDTPRDINWLSKFEQYMSQNKDLYTKYFSQDCFKRAGKI